MVQRGSNDITSFDSAAAIQFFIRIHSGVYALADLHGLPCQRDVPLHLWLVSGVAAAYFRRVGNPRVCADIHLAAFQFVRFS